MQILQSISWFTSEKKRGLQKKKKVITPRPPDLNRGDVLFIHIVRYLSCLFLLFVSTIARWIDWVVLPCVPTPFP